jgi:hypothetical protein
VLLSSGVLRKLVEGVLERSLRARERRPMQGQTSDGERWCLVCVVVRRLARGGKGLRSRKGGWSPWRWLECDWLGGHVSDGG